MAWLNTGIWKLLDSFGEPILQVVASPAIAPLDKFSPSDSPGFNFREARDLTTPPLDQMLVVDTTCPFLVMSNGFSRSISPTISNCLESTSPLFIPSDKGVAGSVSIEVQSPIIRAFFFPTMCASPIRMFWNSKNQDVLEFQGPHPLDHDCIHQSPLLAPTCFLYFLSRDPWSENGYLAAISQ